VVHVSAQNIAYISLAARPQRRAPLRDAQVAGAPLLQHVGDLGIETRGIFGHRPRVPEPSLFALNAQARPGVEAVNGIVPRIAHAQKALACELWTRLFKVRLESLNVLGAQFV
jgi:hypothetical protein